MGKVFKSEKDVRDEVRRVCDDVCWIEPARGGTFGVPDCFVPIEGGRVLWLELKVGTADMLNLNYKVRPAQRHIINMLDSYNIPVRFLVGEKGGSRLWMIPAAEYGAIEGKVDLTFSHDCFDLNGEYWEVLTRHALTANVV